MLQLSYAGPYLVLQRNDKFFRLQVGDQVEVESAKRLKPHTRSPPVSAVPPRRGWPPGSSGAGISPRLADPDLVGAVWPGEIYREQAENPPIVLVRKSMT